jgi:threonine aldolase
VGAIDLRSDFLTHGTPAMAAAASAASDSRCFGLREDPWQRRLEARIAGMLDKEDALVFPTCTMANTAALMLNAAPGSTVVTQPGAHALGSEANAGAALGGLRMTAVDGTGATPPLSAWQAALSVAADAQRAPVALAVLENTHMRSGGVPLPQHYVESVAGVARAAGAQLHLDGARLLYASHARGASPAALAAPFDTVSFSLNKTVGAPIAAALAGTASAIERALVLRQRLGGGLRPTGALSAASLAGLDDLSHIAHANALAAKLAEALATLPHVAPEPAPTNLVLVKVVAPWTAAALCERLAAAGIRALAVGADQVRFATYRGITGEHIDYTIAQLREILR